jgi:transposase-like protein
MIERLNQSVKQRTKVAKIFANEDSSSLALGALKTTRMSAATALFLKL